MRRSCSQTPVAAAALALCLLTIISSPPAGADYRAIAYIDIDSSDTYDPEIDRLIFEVVDVDGNGNVNPGDRVDFGYLATSPMSTDFLGPTQISASMTINWTTNPGICSEYGEYVYFIDADGNPCTDPFVQAPCFGMDYYFTELNPGEYHGENWGVDYFGYYLTSMQDNWTIDWMDDSTTHWTWFYAGLGLGPPNYPDFSQSPFSDIAVQYDERVWQLGDDDFFDLEVDCPGPTDTDGDGVNDEEDNCPGVTNTDQTDTDLDGVGDACDDDDDGDGVLDGDDNCQFTANADQIDLDFDGLGDACDADVDGDGTCDDPAIQIGCTGGPDNCPSDPNPFQDDTDLDGAGDVCDEDDDNDGICDTDQDGTFCTAGPDNCPTVANPDQADSPDSDGIGDVCDADDDNDGTDDGADNCPVTANPDQNDTDNDGDGDACDPDDDGDGVLDGNDNCQFVSNVDQADADADGIGDACNDAFDIDGDEWADSLDNCPEYPNSDQADLDGDNVGDACDPDIDGDGVDNGADLCPGTPQGELVNPENGCTLAQLCPYDGPRGTNQPWKNHGKCLSCVARAAKTFLDLGLIDEVTHGEIVSEVAQSDCGK